uniref:Putative nuclease HARBI1 n=1 Tax=Takifugu rubripes TaxID=31033 RepID=A0A674MP41_TAKRU
PTSEVDLEIILHMKNSNFSQMFLGQGLAGGQFRLIRLNKGTQDIIYLCDVLRPHLQRPTLRSHALTMEEQVSIALRFFASGSFFEVIADSIGVTKSTVGCVVHSVARALSSLLNEYVKFPENEEEISQNKKQFFSIAGMPNTIGVIDCTHIHIQAPHEREWEFVNRKGRHSILILLGDSGYPLRRWLMTPFATVTSNSQQNFNYAHTSTRGTIERINGILKRRFSCLNYLRVEPKEACNIICACIVLHNIAQKRRVSMEEDDVPLPEGLIEAPQPHQTDEPAGRAVRSAMVNLYFS